MTLFDIVVLCVVGLSAVFAFARGAIRETFTIVSWAGAAVVAYLAYPLLLPMAQQVTSQPLAVVGIAVAIAFVVPLVVLKTLAGMIGRAVDQSRVSFLDKLAGLVFGAARGVLVVCALYLAGTFVVREPQALPWVKDAVLLEPVRDGAAWLGQWFPQPTAPATDPKNDAGPDRSGSRQLGTRLAALDGSWSGA